MSSTTLPFPAETSDPATTGNAEAGPSAVQTLAAPGVPDQAGPSGEIKVFAPPSTTPITPAEDLPESYFTPTAVDVQLAQASLVKRSKQLNERPLTLSRVREDERAKKDRQRDERWPNTIIRVRFSDRTQIQQSFPSSSKIQAVYAFVRDSLAEEVKNKPFVLYQPPNRPFPEHPEHPPPPKNKPRFPPRPNQAPPGPPPNPTLAEMELVPQSVLLIRFEDDELNASDRPAALLPSLLAKSAPLPTAVPEEPVQPVASSAPADNGKRKDTGAAAGGEKKMPKWLQKGLLKK